MSDVHNAGVEPEVEGGAPPAEPPVRDRGVDGPGSGRTPLRRQLEDSVDETRKAETARAAKQPKPQRSRARQEQDAEATEGEEPEVTEGEQPEAVTDAPPKAFSKEAQAEWATTPPNVRAAVLKRETDVARGVHELKQRYSDIDQALSPRMEMIRAHGHTPAQAVHQLFSWFEALSGDVQRVRSGQPPVAFNALLNSFGMTPAIFGALQQQAPTQEAQPEEQGAVPPAIQQYIGALEQKLGEFQRGVDEKFGGLYQNFQQANQQKTQEVLDHWSKDKPHFEEVRSLMAYLIGSGAVAPLSNGAADLDTAYDMALYANPQVRAQMLDGQRKAAADERKRKVEAERKAQQEQADKSRRAGGSLSTGAPGMPVDPTKKPLARRSVRDSIKDAISEVQS